MTDDAEKRGPATASARPKSELTALIKASETMAADFLAHLCGRIVTAITDSTKALQDKLFEADGNSQLHDELKVLLQQEQKMAEAFRQAFSHHYHKALEAKAAGAQHYYGSDKAPQSGFSLVDDTQLEEWLTIDQMVAKIQDRCGDELGLLEERFRHLMPGASISKHRLPLGPDKICHAFHDALEALEVSVTTRAHCYGLLDAVLTREVANLYTAVNQYLATKGVLPTLKPAQKSEPAARPRPEARDSRSTITPTAAPAGAAAGAGVWVPGIGGAAGTSGGHPSGTTGGTGSSGGGPAGGIPQPLHEQTFEAIQTLLRAHFAQAIGSDGGIIEGSAAAGGSALPVTPMLIDTLSALQRDDSAIERSGELIRGGLRHYVHGRYSAVQTTGKGGRINQIDDETIEVISMIFDYILDDRSLPDFMKALIGRLQIPILKVAIVDRGFFSQRNHPARQLLNELAQAGSGWRDENEAAKDRLFEKLESIVRRILTEFESDVTIFEVLLADLRAFVEEETRKYREAQEQFVAKARETERIERIKTQVAQDIASRLFGHELPEEVRDFFVAPWRQYVTAVTLEEGEDGDARRQALDWIDELLWSLTPKKTPEDRRRLTRLLPAMLTAIQAGLRHIDYGEQEAENFIRSLERHHFVSLKTGARAERQAQRTGKTDEAGGAPETQAPEEADVEHIELRSDAGGLPSIDWGRLASFDDVVDPKRLAGTGLFEKMLEEMDVKPEQDDGPRIEDEFTELVRNLKVGTWVELQTDDGRDMRAKLAWKGEGQGNYAFINRQFKVIAERPLYVLADQFRHGVALVIDNVALFDRAVDGVISGIMKLAGASGR